jgi:cellulose synthase/poly-beta-1,6-N-acetylglucosamine synthase-like glycosyltransferase
MDPAPTLSFVIPVRDSAAHLRRCLASIAATATGVSVEVMVADNGSGDDSVEVARAAGARILRLPRKRVSHVRNLAALAARGELIAFVDADHELAPGWTAAAVDLMRDPSVAAAGAQYRAPAPGTWVQRMYDRLRRHRPGTQDVDWLPGGNLVMRRSMFEQLGGFDSSLETCEDVDLCQRILAAGGRIVASDRLISVHRGDPPTLRALFFGELWRGRDNLRVSLRAPLRLKAVPSVAFPLIYLMALLALLVGLFTFAFGGWLLAAAGVLAIASVVVLRTASLLLNGASGTRGPIVLLQAVLVATVYDTARALALVSRPDHGMRRTTGHAR